jgi:RNA polymerase sigma-70 factor (ECF subfamily)
MRLARQMRAASAKSEPCLSAFGSEIGFVYRSLRRHGVDSADAEDLAQDVFLVMWRRWSEYQPARPLRPWLAGIIHKIAYRHVDRRRRFGGQETPDLADPRPDQEARLERARAIAVLAQALDRLSPDQRAVVVMHDLDGVAMREVARRQAVPLFTAYTRLRSARRKLARSVAEMGRPRHAPTGMRAVLAFAHGRPALLAVGAAVLSILAALLARPPGRPGPRPREATSPQPTPASVAIAPPTARSGPIARWSFDESLGSPGARDGSGQGHDCVLRHLGGGSGGGAWTDGVIGGALSLNGRRWLECPAFDRPGRLDGELTIALWVRVAPGATGKQVLVTRQLGTGGDRLFSLRLNGGNIELLSHVWQKLLRRRHAATNRWVHVAAVRELERISLYLGGVRVAGNADPSPRPLGGAGTPLLIGGHINGPEVGAEAHHLFRGDLDELAIYDRALAPEEIRALAALQPTGE